jgi:hypothetical protein
MSHCHTCPHIQPPPYSGPCACLRDGRDIIAHMDRQYCPHPDGPRFGDGKQPADWHLVPTVKLTIKQRTPSGPGEVMRSVLVSLGFRYDAAGLRCPSGAMVSACGCEAMRQQMNRWGYLGCLRHRRELVKWFAGKAGECGIDIGAPGIMALLRAGLKQWRSS